MWQLTACKISVRLSFLNWIKNERIFYRTSELMLPTLIQRYDKKSFQFQNCETNKFYRLADATFYNRIIPCINLLKLSWIENVYF